MTNANDPRQRLIDEQAERAVCGSILIDPDCMLKLAGTLKAEDFYLDRARWVYDAALELYQQQQPIDHVTMCNALERKGRLVEAGGAAYLTHLINDTPTALNVEAYSEVVVKLSTLRGLVNVAGQIAKVAYGANGQSIAVILEQVRKLIDGVTPTTSTDEVLLWEDSLERFIDAQAARHEIQVKAKNQSRVVLDFPWQNTLKRFRLKARSGTLAIVVAGSGIGKTTFMECCSEHWARQGHHVAFFHLEISHQGMLDRRTSRMTGLPIHRVEEPQEADWPLLIEARSRMAEYDGGITYVHCPGWSARQITAKARELHARGLCDVMVVDYIQKVRLWMPKGYNKSDALADSTEVLKSCVEQLGIGGIAGSQVNKKAEEAGRVTAAHIRGSGEIDEKGNITIILNRDILTKPMNDGKYEVGERSPVLDVRVDKNTMGPTGECQLAIQGERFLITELDRREAR